MLFRSFFYSAIALVAAVQAQSSDQVTELPDGFYFSPPLDPVSKIPGAQIVKVRYQARTLRAGGELWNAISPVANPCAAADCYIHTIVAGLEYENGTNANTHTGGWLHHMVLLHRRGLLGSSIGDTFCAPVWPRRFFASGNERTVVRANEGYGIRMEKNDQVIMIIDLMNESDETQTYYPTVTYEIVTGAAMATFKEAQLLWLDITGCGISEYPAKTGYYEIKTPIFTSPISGPLLYAGGHVHDGGERFIMYQNGKEICVAENVYGRTPEFQSHHGIHISDTSICPNLGGTVNVGDEFHGVAIYNGTKYPQMGHDGQLHSIMGIGNIFVGTGRTG